jgi:hypothetical protein
VKARGRRFETAAHGAFLGLVAYMLEPWLFSVLFIVLLLGGTVMQGRAERRHLRTTYQPEIKAPLSSRQWLLFRGELNELVERYRKRGS